MKVMLVCTRRMSTRRVNRFAGTRRTDEVGGML